MPVSESEYDAAAAQQAAAEAAIVAEIAARVDGAPAGIVTPPTQPSLPGIPPVASPPAGLVPPPTQTAGLPPVPAPPVANGIATSPTPAPPAEDPLAAKLLARIAELESRLVPPAAEPPQEPAAPGFDPAGLWADPYTQLQRAGVDPDHVTRLLVARAMGNQAPEALRVAVASAQPLGAVHQQVAALQAQVAEMQRAGRRDAYFTQLRAAAPDPAAHAHAATVAAELGATHPTYVADEAVRVAMEHAHANRGVPGARPLSVQEVMTRVNERLAPVAAVLAARRAAAQPAPASPQGAVPAGQKTPPPPATAAGLAGAPPPVVTLSFEEETQAILADVLSKYQIQ